MRVLFECLGGDDVLKAFVGVDEGLAGVVHAEVDYIVDSSGWWPA